jgi:prepilin-type N-terminal cleavage/methylation domain-containing protein
VTKRVRTSRDRRSGEAAFTLIELLVSVAILAIIGGVVATAFGIGLRAVRSGGVGDRFQGAHDFMILEQWLGKDGARAACVHIHGDLVVPVYGRNQLGTPRPPCSTGLFASPASACSDPNSSATLCFGWPVLGSNADLSDSTCRVVVYSTPPKNPGVLVTRTEYSNGVQVSASINLTADPVNFTPGNVTRDNSHGYWWLRTLPITIQAVGVSAGQFTQSLAIHPIASDPGGPSSSITSQGSPC